MDRVRRGCTHTGAILAMLPGIIWYVGSPGILNHLASTAMFAGCSPRCYMGVDALSDAKSVQCVSRLFPGICDAFASFSAPRNCTQLGLPYDQLRFARRLIGPLTGQLARVHYVASPPLPLPNSCRVTFGAKVSTIQNQNLT